MNADVVIIGAGPAGIFTALEMVKKGSKQKIIMVEKGQAVENRHCPKDKTKKCVNCKPYCHITTGFSGAGAFSDGKLSLSYEVGGDLPTLITPELAHTFNASLKRRLADFSRKYPLLCRLERSTPEGSVTYVLDKSRLSIRLVPPYSEERKAAAREYAKEHGFQVVVTEEKIA